ncbi:hypothetical protein ACLK19_05060 [Escherichia coli]
MRRALVVMSRNPCCVIPGSSSLEELANSTFLPAIGEIDELDPKGVKRVVMCLVRFITTCWNSVVDNRHDARHCRISNSTRSR